MNDYASNAGLDAIADHLRGLDGPVMVLTHAKPDGDALGSVLAMTATLRSLGLDARPFFVAPIADSVRGLDPQGTGTVLDPADADALPRDAAAYLVLDTGAFGQLGPQAQAVREHLDRTVIIDHHLSGDVEAALRFIDGTAAACCEIVADLIERLTGSGELDRATAEWLFAGVASDTGWFRFSNTSPRTHRLAARLLDAGVDHSDLYAHLEQSERPEKLKLMVRAVRNLELLCDDRVALMALRKDDFEQSGAQEHETERLVDVPQVVGSVRVVALVTEATHHAAEAQGNGQSAPLTRVSFRSKPGPDAVNVAALANRFGGGGHARAAGAKLEAPVDEVVQRLRDALPEALGNCGFA